jgi:antitoxin HicB
MKEVTFTVHIEPAAEGGYTAFFPALPGCHTQGETLEEVIAMAKDVLARYLECLRSHGDPIPVATSASKLVGFDFPLRMSLAR